MLGLIIITPHIRTSKSHTYTYDGLKLQKCRRGDLINELTVACVCAIVLANYHYFKYGICIVQKPLV